MAATNILVQKDSCSKTPLFYYLSYDTIALLHLIHKCYFIMKLNTLSRQKCKERKKLIHTY